MMEGGLYVHHDLSSCCYLEFLDTLVAKLYVTVHQPTAVQNRYIALQLRTSQQ